MMKKATFVVALGVLAMMLTGCGKDSDKDAAPKTAPEKVSVQAGVNDAKDRNIAVLAFLPASVPCGSGLYQVRGRPS